MNDASLSGDLPSGGGNVAGSATAGLSFADEVAGHRAWLLRFARLQLRNDAWAEDAVSDTLLAALSKPQSFGNRSQLRTWLTGILKHKLIDALRLRTREVAYAHEDDAGGTADELDALVFKQDGHFAEAPAEWGDPERELGSRQFFEILEACVERLPPALGRVFMMREWLELEVPAICQELAITSTNLYVQLHRSRLRLRECLELHWLGADPSDHRP